ncbi:SDR family NAD(P)-dependent oxidoreductase [Domibacillus sp. A3M-37]|uniref:SDR family NAD(P)-dependent oxidoreductase n=1 Tax=Domibacillus sp. A3M-37 TaxID=2962037 RepID=UPI0035C0CF08
MISLNGKTILITDATSGIGRETSLLLNKLNANLILLERSNERLEQWKELMPN